MSRSKLVQLVKYTSIFSQIWYLSREEAEAKLATELELYEKWRVQFPDQVQEPNIDKSTFKATRETESRING